MIRTNSTRSVRGCAVSDSRATITPEYGLYPYQRQVLHDVLDVLLPADQAGRRGRAVAHLPTGAGKTRIACHVAAAILNQRFSEGKVVIWLASSEELCDQAASSLASAWHNVGNREVGLHRFWGSESATLASLSEGFLVAGLPKLWSLASRHPGFLAPIANEAAGVIFDEAHQAIAPTYAFITEQLTAYGAPLLGLTATPGRGYQIGDDDLELAEFFDDNKVSIDPRGHDSVVTYLIRNQYLAEPEFVDVQADATTSLREPRQDSDYSAADLRALGRDEAWRDSVISQTTDALERHHRVIVFCPSVPCALAAATALTNSGLRASAIVAGTPDEERQEVISAFRDPSGAPMALLNFGVLTAGFDAPATSCVIIARPTRSLVLYSQMVGRAMRGIRSGGNRRCTIYTVVDEQHRGFASVIDAFSHWEEIWRTPQTN